jgi:outer membrane protein OmpA-like peptidoglycan-associated protein
MKIRIPLLALIAAAMTGCTSYSTPTTNTNLVTLRSGEQAWQVQCLGLFASSDTCKQQAQKICKDETVRVIGAVDKPSSDGASRIDPRELTFMCGDAPVATPVSAAPSPGRLARSTRRSAVNFATDSAELSRGAQGRLNGFIDAISDSPIQHLSIAGYTDSTGSMALNGRLSVARARSAQDYLMAHGVRADSYEVQGFGPASPVASNATAEGRAQNRRVEIQADGVELRASDQ